MPGILTQRRQLSQQADPYAAFVRLLLHCDGANGGVSTADSSRSPKAVVFDGDTSISTTQSRFGGSSLAFTGSNNAVRIGSQGDFNFGTEDFTIEAWVYPQTGGSGLRTVYSKSATGTGPVLIAHNGTNYVYYVSSTGTSWDIASAAIIGPRTLNQWDHIAVVRNGSAFTSYLNGVAGATATSSASLTANAEVVRIGSNFAGAAVEPWTGYIDEIRVTRGVARYVTNFSPPQFPFPNP